MYLEQLSSISNSAQLTEKEIDLLWHLTSPISNKEYDFMDLYNLFSKLIQYNQGENICSLYKGKKDHFETEPSAYPDLDDIVHVG